MTRRLLVVALLGLVVGFAAGFLMPSEDGDAFVDGAQSGHFFMLDFTAIERQCADSLAGQDMPAWAVEAQCVQAAQDSLGLPPWRTGAAYP